MSELAALTVTTASRQLSKLYDLVLFLNVGSRSGFNALRASWCRSSVIAAGEGFSLEANWRA